MTVATSVTSVSTSMVLAIVDEARTMKYQTGVIGLRGLPGRTVAMDVPHDGRTVRVRPAESALAVREVLSEHREGDWLVVVTDRDDDDLGAGILAHFVWQRLRSPDPWEAVRHRFSATGIDPALTSRAHDRDLAASIVAATPAAGWPAAPAGVLTRTHALSAVAATHLGFDGDTADVLGVLRWSLAAPSIAALGELRRSIGDLLADSTLDWIAERAGTAAGPIRTLLASGELADIVPLGVVLHLLTTNDLSDAEMAHQAQLVLVRLEGRWGDSAPTRSALTAFGQATGVLLTDLVHDRRADADVRRALDRADVLLTQLQATSLARYSDLLASGLRARFAVLADAVRRAVGPNRTDTGIEGVEAAWRDICSHRLAEQSPTRAPFEAAVRLVRWLAEPDTSGSAPQGAALLASMARQYLESASWADAAVNDAFAGVDDPQLSPVLQAVVAAARERRRQQERMFAAALAAASPAAAGNGVPSDAGTVWYLERLLPGAIIPLAKKAPVLLLVMDGMSAATATELLADATTRLGWLEAALPGADGRHRAAALSVLPSVTEVSRASLLCGRLAQGQQTMEQSGYAELTAQGGKITAKLFHKKCVDTTAAGWSVSHDVGDALDDTDLRLVTVVLNTIDDALDRSDPAGTVWTADAVKHLEPLLARAASAGRTVVMTADHGHVVERREGTQKSYAQISSSRSRSVTGTLDEGEVQVAGPRVLAEGHRAVLAVDDRLRYGPLKAGYHGGASAAEVVVPVAVLVPDESSNPAGLALLPPQMPAWWLTSQLVSTPPPVTVAVSTPPTMALTVRDDGSTLFDLEPVGPAPATAQRVEARAATASLGRAVVTSRVYKGQRKVAGRLIVTDDQVAHLVDALVVTHGTRLLPPLAAQALRVPQTRLRGALTQVQQLLNVEGYAVLAIEAATGVVVLSRTLLEEQFGVRS